MDYGQEGNIRIRTAREKDAKGCLEIYAPYVERTAVTFEYEVPSLEEFRERIRKTEEKYPWIVAEKDGKLQGYAYAGPFHARPAYDWAVETSIYVRQDCRGHGIGKKLYEALEQVLKGQHILNANACIAWPKQEDEYLTKDSEAFHRRLGYRLAGEFLNGFMHFYTDWENAGYAREYRNRSLVLGKGIQVLNSAGARKARALDIDENCRLLVEYEDGSREWLRAGEISILSEQQNSF